MIRHFYVQTQPLDPRDVALRVTDKEIVLRLGESRFAVLRKGTTGEELRQDAQTAAECAATFHKLAAALTAEADHHDAAQQAAAEQAAHHASADQAAEHAATVTDPAGDTSTGAATTLTDLLSGTHAMSPAPMEDTGGHTAGDNGTTDAAWAQKANPAIGHTVSAEAIANPEADPGGGS